MGATHSRGGLALTASHNPSEYNALKMFNARGLFFNNYERSEMLDLYHQSNFRQATHKEIDLPPLIVLIGVVAGAGAFGIMGALLATPVIATGKLIFRYIYGKIMENTPVAPAPPGK